MRHNDAEYPFYDPGPRTTQPYGGNIVGMDSDARDAWWWARRALAILATATGIVILTATGVLLGAWFAWWLLIEIIL